MTCCRVLSPALAAFMALALVLAAAGPAAALSCLRPDAAIAYQEAVASDRSFAVFHGRLSFDPARMPPGIDNGRAADAPPPPPLVAQAAGNVLGPDGFVQGYSGPVILQSICAGPWCGRLDASPVDALAFLLIAEAGPTLVLDPCYARVFSDPSRETLLRMVSCIRGEGCAPLAE